MSEDRDRLSVLQCSTACDVVLRKYDYLVEHVDAIRIFPYLVSSGLVEQCFRQYLDGERTDRDKMMALLRELTRSPKETWFDRFTNALAKVPQYEGVARSLLGDFTRLMEERMARPTPEQRRLTPRLSASSRSTSEPLLVIKFDSTVSAVDGMHTMQKAVESTQDGHKAALLEMQKANARLLEAEKGKVLAEAEKRALEEKVKLHEKLAEVEMHKQLLVKESQTYKDRATRLEVENEQLTKSLTALHLQEETMQNAKEDLEKTIACLQAEVEESRRERDVEVTALEEQLSDVREWQQREEMRFKELGCLRSQLERSVARATTLEEELAGARRTNERLEQEMRKLKEDLEVATTDRGSLKVKYRQSVNKADRLRAELTRVKEELTEVRSVYSGSDGEACKENKYELSKRAHSEHDVTITQPPRSQVFQYPSTANGHDLDVSST